MCECSDICIYLWWTIMSSPPHFPSHEKAPRSLAHFHYKLGGDMQASGQGSHFSEEIPQSLEQLVLKPGLFHHHWLVLLNAILLVWPNTDMLVFVHLYMCLQDVGPLANWVLNVSLVVFKRQVVLPYSMGLKLLNKQLCLLMNSCEVEVQILASSFCPGPCLLYTHIN